MVIKMTLLNVSLDFIKIPYLLDDYKINYNGDMLLNGKRTTLSSFNDHLKLGVKDVNVLQLITFHNFKWPPKYWSKIHSIKLIEGVATPENMIMGLDEPVPSLEFDGFYMIPYFSNYVISRTGVLIKRSDGRVIEASLALTQYYTYRMTSDDSKTGNALRHRILALAFKKYTTDPDMLTVNHINGIRGFDELDNLEWCTLEENIQHAIATGLYEHVHDIEVKNINTDMVFIFPSQAAVCREFNLSSSTVSNYVKTNGNKAFNGFQFRQHPSKDPWPVVETDGGFLITYPNGVTKKCSSVEAADICGVTRTSLMRLLREGRNKGNNGIVVARL